MKKVKIAQIGLNHYSHGACIFDSLKRLGDIYEIAGYALPENEREKYPYFLSGLDGYKELTVDEIMANPEIEAVAIETDEIYITKYALMAAEHNKHIHMEKPGGLSLPDFEKLIALMKKSGKVFHTGYMYRYNPYVIDLMQRAKRGELGEILSVDAEMNCVEPDDLREWLEAFPGGMMFFLGCHLVDLILQLKGAPDRVIPLSRSTGVNGIQSKDFGMAVLEYENGVSIAKTSGYEYGGFARRNLIVSGTKRTIEINPLEMFSVDPANTDLFAQKTEYATDDWGDRGVSEISPVYNRYDGMLEAFARMVAGEIENPYSYDYELLLYKTVLQCCGMEI